MEAWAILYTLEKACVSVWKIIFARWTMILVTLLNGGNFLDCSWRLALVAMLMYNLICLRMNMNLFVNMILDVKYLSIDAPLCVIFFLKSI